MMHNPSVTTIAIVMTAIEECISRATMVDRDNFFRRRSGKADYTSNELAKQRIIWTAQTGNSMLIEVVAIVVHAASVHLFLPHRFIFNFGYGSSEDTEQTMSTIVVSMLLELVSELITDHVAIHAETAHGVPISRYFTLLSKTAFAVTQMGSLICATGIVLWTFSRIPTALFCDDPNPCSCLDLGTGASRGSNFEIYREVCTTCGSNDTSTCANFTAIASARFAKSPSDGMDADFLAQIGFALMAVVATSTLVFASVNVAKHRRAQQSNKVLILKHSKQIEQSEAVNAELKKSLKAAQQIVNRNMKEGGAVLAAYKIRHADLTMDVQLGEGSFGTVYHGTYRGNECAVKTVRATKVTDAMVQEFLGELTLMAPLRHPNLVGLVGGCWTDGPDKLCIVLEFCSKGSLGGMVKDPSNTWEAHYFGIALDVALCFQYLHHEQPGEPLIHRDLKPDNVLIAGDGTAKVADFGESTRFEDTLAAEEDDGALTMTLVGTPMYCVGVCSWFFVSNAQKPTRLFSAYGVLFLSRRHPRCSTVLVTTPRLTSTLLRSPRSNARVARIMYESSFGACRATQFVWTQGGDRDQQRLSKIIIPSYWPSFKSAGAPSKQNSRGLWRQLFPPT